MSQRANRFLTMPLLLAAFASLLPAAAQAQFTTETKLTASDAAAGDAFGWSVSISGEMAVVGAVGDHGHSGSAYVYARNQGGENAWGEVAKLTAADAREHDLFGESVSISGNVAIVGAWGNDDSGSVSGAAYIYSPEPGTLGLALSGFTLMAAVARPRLARPATRVR